MDIDNIPFGVDFREHIDAAVGQCDVVLAVIGPRWVGKAFIRRRIDEPKDFVRVELESALRRNLPVIPILIDNAGMPGEADLPPSLTRLAFRNAIEVDHGRDFHLHIDRLIRGIDFHFQKLKRTPPDPPTSLKVQILGDRIRLSWTPPPADGLGPLTYVVVRKRGEALEHPGDGTRIAEVSASEFDDMHVAPGDTVAYAVLSSRGSVEAVAAISLGPCLFLADVRDVRVESRNREVELWWSLPRGVSEVRVIRKRGGPPTSHQDGYRLPPARDHALDRDLDPNEVYHYGIYAIYAMADGRRIPAPGVVVSARPQGPNSTL